MAASGAGAEQFMNWAEGRNSMTAQAPAKSHWDLKKIVFRSHRNRNKFEKPEPQKQFSFLSVSRVRSFNIFSPQIEDTI